jgi:tRNA threonylcarbamoyladenosine biosynthesis protein TsaB
MPKLLAIETSSEACSVALNASGRAIEFVPIAAEAAPSGRDPAGTCAVGGRLAAEGSRAQSAGDEAGARALLQGVLEYHEHAPLRHAELLLPAVERLLAEAGVELRALDAIAFGRGPGSFTSLRIGIGVVQGLAWAAGLPVVPRSSLAALALDAAESARAADGARIRVAVDARMQEVFTADFDWRDRRLRRRGEERVCAPGDAAHRPDGTQPFITVGNGFARFDELAALGRGAHACLPDRWPRAAMILRLAEEWLETHDPLPPALAQPVYIRDQVAEKPAG